MTSEWVQEGNIMITSNETEGNSGDVSLLPEKRACWDTKWHSMPNIFF